MSRTTEEKRRKQKLKEFKNSEEYTDKLNKRLKINDACNRSEEAKIYAASACKNSAKFFINNFLWTPNDKYDQYHFPFILYDFQEEYVDWLVDHIENGKDGLVEKSREMGATWVTLSVFYWAWLFNDHFNALIGSYKQDLVDDGTKDSLFGMLDYHIRNTPDWMLPNKWNNNKHRNQMKLVNPENFNVIRGDTMNKAFGRGSRRSVTFFDEGAHWEYFKDAWTSAGDTTNCRLTVSTPYGYNAFADLRDSGLDVKTLHWKQHPLKDNEWYEYEKERRTPEEVAQELDISYQKSKEGRIYPEWDDVEYGDFGYDPTKRMYVSWDFGQSDDTAIIWWQKDENTGEITIVDCYWNNGKTIDFYVPFVTGVVPSDGYSYTDKDLDVIEKHRSWKNGTHFGDPAGRFTNQVTDTSVIEVLREHGIHVNFKKGWNDFGKRIRTSRLLMRDKLRINDNERTKYLNICMINSQYKEVRRGGQRIVNSKNQKPRHDQYSHLRSSFEYGALGLEQYKPGKVRIHDKIKTKNSRDKAISY